MSEGAAEDEEEQASVARRPARPARGDRCSLNPCLSGGACRPSELPPGCARTGLILLEHEGAARHGGGWEVRAGHQAARLPVSGLVTGRGSEVEPGIRKSQNPSPRWGRQAVVQVWTEFRKPSTPFWKRFLPSSPRSCDQRVALLLSGGDRAGSRAPQRHQPAAPFLQLGFTVPGPGVRRDGRALRRLRDPAGRTGRMSQRPRRHFQLRFVPAWNARPSAENAAAARKRCRL